jgi:alkaline phosphatase D
MGYSRRSVLTRRDLLAGSLASMAACRVGTRTKLPAITHGVSAGDVATGRANVWARCSEPARMVIEWDTTPRFASPRRVRGPIVTPEHDHAATVALDGLPDAQTIAYRIRFEREAARGASEWSVGRFATPRTDRFRVAWTGDTCGQGYGRNPDFGGLAGFAAVRAAEPAVFVNSGDLFYADNPILAERKEHDGRIWRNVTNERVARVAQELDDFRARIAYNFDDEHVRALAAEVPIVAQWDDHETHNNWFPGQQLADERYRDRDASRLAALALRAIHEWYPITPGPVHRVLHYGPLLDIVVVDLRSFRTPNDANRGDGAVLFGSAQAKWLVDTLAASTARWKLVAIDQPFSVVIDDGPTAQEGFGQGDPGAPLGREKELASILRELRARGVKNTVWITADVHFAAAHRCTGTDFDPLWQFIAGPIHAGSFTVELDRTFGPEPVFEWKAPPGSPPLGPWDGLQNFGTIDVAADALAVALVGIDGLVRYRVELPYVA